ncbi:hypothetical protein [Streptomyces sp. NL15-2K]|uniref:hypothetical protein n=1 Tax=Streptomyces sp. NL15-2K TaxID=376149 RepID=UPI001C0E9D74|nr:MULTISPECIES: hypothetical protein [Actinomycetes]WKX15474.1 hypothetical protein Q4V64_51450 [Kutzneria buriramensis]
MSTWLGAVLQLASSSGGQSAGDLEAGVGCAKPAGRGRPAVPLDRGVVDDDRALDQWIRTHLGTARHTCGTAPVGPQGAVDAHGRCTE